MSEKQRYTGRSLEELISKDVKMGDLSVAETIMVNSLGGKVPDSTPGAVSRFVTGSFMTLKATGRGIMSAGQQAAEKIQAAIDEQKLVDKLAKSRDIFYKRGMAKLALQAHDMTQEQYDEAIQDLDNQEKELNL